MRLRLFTYNTKLSTWFCSTVQRRDFLTLHGGGILHSAQICLPDIEHIYLPGELALSCNPSYWEARTVGWFEVLRPLPGCHKDVQVRTMVFLLWMATRGRQGSPMKKLGQTTCRTEWREFESRLDQRIQTQFSILLCTVHCTV